MRLDKVAKACPHSKFFSLNTGLGKPPIENTWTIDFLPYFLTNAFSYFTNAFYPLGEEITLLSNS